MAIMVNIYPFIMSKSVSERWYLCQQFHPIIQHRQFYSFYSFLRYYLEKKEGERKQMKRIIEDLWVIICKMYNFQSLPLANRNSIRGRRGERCIESKHSIICCFKNTEKKKNVINYTRTRSREPI